MSNQKSTPQRPGNVLVLEDESIERCAIVQMLQAAGYHVREAADVPEARAILRRQSTWLVLCDINLGPAEPGLVLLEEVASRTPEIAVVMITGVADTQTAVDCLRQGAFDYLMKPYSRERLLEIVARTLERQHALISARREAEEEFAVLSRFSSENPNPILRVLRDGTLVYANGASDPVLQRIGCRVGDTLPAFLHQLVTAAAGGDHRNVEVEANNRVFSFDVIPIDRSHYVYLYGHDITPLKEAEGELVRLKDQAIEMALHDPLTGLPNRVLLEDRLQQALARTERSRLSLAVAFLDVDRFKKINDEKGHRAGDELLVALSRCLRQAVRRTDTVARWGGDEVVLLLPEIRDRKEAEQICERIRSFVAAAKLHVTVSIGLSILPDDGATAETLLQRADAALYEAKSKGGDKVVFFSDSMQAINAAEQRTRLRDRLAQAILAREITIHYQPIIDAGTGRVASVEALARWCDAELGHVPPGSFIPVAETMGMIGDLGREVFRGAVAQFKCWKEAGLLASLSVNLSVRQLFEPELLVSLLEITAGHGIRPQEIVLEMTESQALLGLASEGQRLDELARSGFQLAIDDFGLGHSSLSSLHLMPVNELKIDARFVRAVRTEKGCRLTRSIIEMARAINLRTVMEGLETEEEVALVSGMGPDRLQGYFFSHPLPAAELTEFLVAQGSEPPGNVRPRQ